MSVVPEEPLPTVPSHPEEIKSVFDLRVGRLVTMQCSARITPAGLVCAGIAVAIMTLSLAPLASASRRRLP